MPCIATLFMISRELGRKTAAWIAVFVFGFAFLVGGLVNHAANWLRF
jgi:Fe2+ transport system protein B